MASLLPAKETVLFACGVNTVPTPANQRPTAARAKEEPSMLDVAVLPLFILAYTAPFSFIFLSIVFISL